MQIGHRVRSEVLAGGGAEYGAQIVAAAGRQLAARYGRGFDEKSLRHMLRFAQAFRDAETVSALRRQLSWRDVVSVGPPEQAHDGRVESSVPNGALRLPVHARLCRAEAGHVVTKGRKPASLAGAPPGYAAWLDELKSRIESAQQRAALAVNRELVLLYWQLGRDILQRQTREGWGAKVIDGLACDLKAAFPASKGFSPRNLKYMRRFAESWPDPEFVQQAAAQLPWFHLCTLLDKVKDGREREWYLHAAAEHGWSRSVLVMQIETRAHARRGKAVTNFAHLPKPQSDLARESLKDPYRFDFLSLGTEAQERQIENALIAHITEFLLELGAGFAFVGRQLHLEVGGEDFYLDLLFYHLKLRAYVVVELKATDFKPEHAGKLSFYLTAVDAQTRGDHGKYRRSSGSPSTSLRAGASCEAANVARRSCTRSAQRFAS